MSARATDAPVDGDGDGGVPSWWRLGAGVPLVPLPPQQGSEFENLTIPGHSGTVDPSAFCSQHIVASRHTRK